MSRSLESWPPTPFVTASALDRGNNATLARYFESMPGAKLTTTEVQVPGGKIYKNGDQCDGKSLHRSGAVHV